jgi:hypothetical protein
MRFGWLGWRVDGRWNMAITRHVWLFAALNDRGGRIDMARLIEVWIPDGEVLSQSGGRTKIRSVKEE